MSEELKLLGTTDAREWATEFCKLNRASDLGFMIGWFANAIETGRSFGRLEVEDALRAENERLWAVAEAAKRAKDLLLSEFEHRAEQCAIRAGLGVGEWDAFMPKAWYELDSALADLDQKMQ